MKHFIIAALWICSARNVLGHYYSAQGASQAEAQDAALKACQANSFICYPTSCSQSV